MKFIQKVCSHCGGINVKSDAYATWDFRKQEWVLDQTFYKGAYCDDCDGECRIEDEPLSGDALLAAVTREVAMNDGWLPGDEDTAEQYVEGNEDLESEVEQMMRATLAEFAQVDATKVP
jgi:hypothetical protein